MKTSLVAMYLLHSLKICPCVSSALCAPNLHLLDILECFFSNIEYEPSLSERVLNMLQISFLCLFKLK